MTRWPAQLDLHPHLNATFCLESGLPYRSPEKSKFAKRDVLALPVESFSIQISRYVSQAFLRGSMRPQILSCSLPTRSRRTISKTYAGLNGLLRCLSTCTDSTFGVAQGQVEGLNKMPKRTNGVRGRSTKDRDMSYDEAREQKHRSPNSLDLSQGNIDGSRNPAAVLASSHGALQRLADVVQYFQSSFTYDISMIEGDYGTEIDREKEIRRLNETVQTLTYMKNEDMDNLRRENEELKANQEATEKEKEKYQEMMEELETQHNTAEAEREEEYQQKLQDEKAKQHKITMAKKAEIEAKSEEKVIKLEKENKKLSAKNEELIQQLSQAEDKLEKKKIRHARVEKSLADENEKLTAELKDVRSEFPVGGQPAEYYAKKFQRISDAIKAVSSKYFHKLPERALAHPEAVHQELTKLNPIFDSTPIWQTEISDFLRIRDVQHIISVCLCDFIWKPFFPQGSLPNNDVVGPFLEKVSNSLSQSGGRSEGAWRALTIRGIDDLSAGSSQVEPILHHVLDILRPLTNTSESAELEEDIVKIVNESITLWKTARKDKAKFIIEKCPDLNNKENWQAEDIQGSVETSIPPEEKIDTTGIPPLCLFPSILQKTSRGKTVVVYQGSALFPTSHVWIQAVLAKKAHEEEMAEAVSDARSKVYARRISCSTSPNSPVMGKASVTQT